MHAWVLIHLKNRVILPVSENPLDLENRKACRDDDSAGPANCFAQGFARPTGDSHKWRRHGKYRVPRLRRRLPTRASAHSGLPVFVPLPWTAPVVVRLPCSSTLCDETRDACFHHFIESLPGVDIRPQSILEPVGISSALKGFRRPRNHLDWAKRYPRFFSTPVLFPLAH